MAIDFPASPTVGQQYIFAGTTYTWTSQGVWVTATGAAVTVTANGFRAHKNGTNQTGLTSSTPIKLTLPTEDYDVGGFYDAAQSRWTPPTGIVHISGAVHFNVAGANNAAYIHIYKNGALLKSSTFVTANAGGDGVPIALDDNASGTDYYEMWAQTNSVSGTVDGVGTNTFFQGHTVKGPQGDPGPQGIQGPQGPAGASGGGTGGFTTGDVKATIKTVADTGWVMMNDGTIGDATSGGTTRANVDCVDLFTLIWTNITNANAAVLPGGRGASAAADFAAHKTIALPKALGRVLASAGAGAGLTSRTLGQTLGEEAHVQSAAELANHSHQIAVGTGVNIQASYGSLTPGGGTTNFSIWGGFADNTTAVGGGAAFNVMQPTTFLNYMIKL